MPDSASKFRWLRGVAFAALIVTLVGLLAGLMVPLTERYLDWPTEVAIRTATMVVTVVAVVLWAVVAYGCVRALVLRTTTLTGTDERLERLETLLEDHAASLRKLADLTSLSDQAKSLVFRDREIEVMRETVHAALIRQDYTSAEALVASIEARPAYADEAGRLRKEIIDYRKQTVEEKITTALARVQAILDSHDFARAFREAQRLVRAVPNNAKVAELPRKIEASRNAYKTQLLKSYGEAVGKSDVDHSIELLHELDKYLTPQEAAALQDTARGVFRAKLHNLGVQFAIRVNEQQWHDALVIGQQIVTEFPNSRMAGEVRSKMEQLHARAATK